MPRLHHLADANPFDCYDSVAITPDAIKHFSEAPAPKFHYQPPPGVRLFGPVNISFANDRCNVQIPNELACDQTSMIQNIYARTNIVYEQHRPKLARVFTDWAHASTVTLYVGDKPVRQMNLANLLLRKAGDRDADALEVGEAKEYLDGLAEAIYEGYRLGGGTGVTWESLPDQAELGQPGQLGKRPWRNAAWVAHKHLKAPQVVIVPVRQKVEVLVETNLDALRQLVEVLAGEPPIAPMPLVWVHLEGFSRRDVC